MADLVNQPLNPHTSLDTIREIVVTWPEYFYGRLGDSGIHAIGIARSVATEQRGYGV